MCPKLYLKGNFVANAKAAKSKKLCTLPLAMGLFRVRVAQGVKFFI
jgi:hypothetical protein